MASMVGTQLDSSDDEEWVITSEPTVKPTAVQSTPSKPIAVKQKLTISDASLRTIRNNIPNSARLPPSQPSLNVVYSATPPVPKAQPAYISRTFTPPLQHSTAYSPPNVIYKAAPPVNNLLFISDHDLQKICTEMNAQLLIEKLVQVYKSTEVFFKIRDIETSSMSIESRLRENLVHCTDPCDFILDSLNSLSVYFANNVKNKDLSSKFRRLLAHALCTALARYLESPPTLKERKQPKEQDLIIFDDDDEEEQNLLSFDDISPVTPQITHIVDTTHEEEDDIFHTILKTPVPLTTLKHSNQVKLINMIPIISSPVIVYYAMDVFKLADLLSKDKEYQDQGVALCKLLMKYNLYDESINCIKKLNLFDQFPISTLAFQLFTEGQGHCLQSLYENQPKLQLKLIQFINHQLLFNYAGTLDIVPVKYLNVTSDVQQLSRLKERKFQKSLVDCGLKVLKELDNVDINNYYFILLSQQYASLRFILNQRAIQQMEDGDDLSIEKSSNFNGLIDLVCENDPVLAKLAIKEMIDIGDTVAPPYFASLYKQQEFYCKYNALPVNHRLLGIVKGEQFSRHRSFLKGSPKKNKSDSNLAYYTLPSKVKWMMVDSYNSLMQLKDVLSTSYICGIDTEWIPSFATKSNQDVKTALMQIACDNDQVFLVDLKTLYTNMQLYKIIEKILELLFEDDQILKIAFDFKGDFDLLHRSIPSSKKWDVIKLLDLKALKTMPTAHNNGGDVIVGGLAGVTSTFLGCTLNKRQQLSNWEKRPLSEVQAIYGACDAYCLLDIYYTLKRLNHPFIKNMPKVFNHSTTTTDTASTISSSSRSTPSSTPDLL